MFFYGQLTDPTTRHLDKLTQQPKGYVFMFKKLMINFGLNIVIANAFNALITYEAVLSSYLSSIVASSVPPKALALVPGDSDAEKKTRVIMIAGVLLTAIFDYLILNQDKIKSTIEAKIKA